MLHHIYIFKADSLVFFSMMQSVYPSLLKQGTAVTQLIKASGDRSISRYKSRDLNQKAANL